MRRDLAGMLAHAADGGALIARAIDGVAALQSSAGSWIDRRVGPYRIVREIGRGGMGLVFEAVRDDDEYRKTVALKIAPPWIDAAALRERFRLERQILAELEHPNIARFLDGGTDDGLPYFVMEYVDGQPITGFCEARALDVRERLVLLRQVCAAVHFAHERLVVHRDLKPSNILVSADGTPKLLDFGIAKLLDPMTGGGATPTVDVRWTPDYTSPEQLRGRAVTTRTDVYSLGLVLYELLVGERAQVADASSPVTLERTICEHQPAPPSERAMARHDRGWAGRLRGDLDTIVMTAIRKEPDRRYGTAAALADDLLRYLEGRPILARPSTVTYRAGKFLRRHRAAVAAAVLVLASLVGGLGAAIFEARRADRRFQQVRALANTFVFDIHDRIEHLTGATEARKAIVQTALTYLESLRSDAGSDASLARELASAYFRIGNAQGDPLEASLGDAAGALTSYTRAADLLAPLSARGDWEARRQAVRVETAIANLRQAQGGTVHAKAGYARAEEGGEALMRDGPVDADLLSSVGSTYAADARAALNAYEYPRAERASRRAMELMQRAAEMDPASARFRDDLSLAYSALAQTLHQTGRMPEAANFYRSAVTIREALVKEAPDNATYRRNLLVGYGNLSSILAGRPWENLGDTAGAITALEKATALAEEGRQKDPADRRAWFDIVNAKYRLGSLLADEPRRRDAALETFADAERVTNSLRAEDPKRSSYVQYDGLIEWRTAQTLLAMGRLEEATRRFERARAISAEWMTDRSANLSSVYVRTTAALAELRAKAGDPRARELADQASRALAALPPELAIVDAAEYRAVGNAYREIARRWRAERPAIVQAAVQHLEKSAALLRSFKPVPEAEPLRQKELHGIEAELALCQHLDK